jgi:hypothetical protein
MAENKELIVISAINFTEGGPLSILRDSLVYASEYLSDKYNVIALVHKKSLFDIPNIKYIEYPSSKKSWFFRLYYEWFNFYRLSLKIKPFLWLSLHDITPRVKAERRAVYCHNPSPFYKLKLTDVFVDLKFTLFHYFYSWIYKINISKNNWVIVQQAWLRDEFFARYPVKSVIVAHPSVPERNEHIPHGGSTNPGKTVFFYPTYPRSFKNIEYLCEVANYLNQRGYNEYEIWITIDGTENRYAKKIVSNYSCNSNIKFIGLQTREKIYDLYEIVDCLVFPSMLETWGMPISEFKYYKKPIFVAELPYAHETVAQYDLVKYFDPLKPERLAHYMKLLMDSEIEYDSYEYKIPDQPYAKDWHDLFNMLLQTQIEKNECSRQ